MYKILSSPLHYGLQIACKEAETANRFHPGHGFQKSNNNLITRFIPHFSNIFFLLLFIFFFFSIQPSASLGQIADSPWPMFMHNIDHTGQNMLKGPDENIASWSYQTGSEIRTTPVTGLDGTIYVGTLDGKFHAVSSLGVSKWSYPTEGEIHSTAALDIKNVIYVGSDDGFLYAIQTDGTLKWRFKARAAISSSPIINPRDGTIYFGDENVHLYAVDSDGNLVWEVQLDDEIWASPTLDISTNTLYIGTLNGVLFAMNAQDGTEIWNFNTKDFITGTAAIDEKNESLVFASDEGIIYALNKNNGSIKWTYNTGGDGFETAPGIDTMTDSNAVYMGSVNGNVYALDRNTGILKWQYNFSDAASSPSIDKNGVIYFGSADGKVYALNKDGSLMWKYKTLDSVYSSPSIGENGFLYIGSDDANLYAIGNVSTDSITADFSAEPTTGTKPLTVHFSDKSVGNISSWNWNFGDGETSTKQNPTHEYAKKGEFTVSLTVTGQNDSDTKTIENFIIVTKASQTLKASFSAEPTTGEVPLSVQFKDQSLGNATSWVWDFGDKSNSTEQNPGHNYTSPGEYTVSLTVSDNGNSDTKTIENYISVMSSVTADFSALPTFGEWPLTVQFKDKSKGSISNWQWDFGDGSTSIEQNPIHTYNNTGEFTVTLTVSDEYSSNTKTAENYITAKQQDTTIDLDLSLTELTFGDSLSLTGQITPAVKTDVTLTFTSKQDIDTQTVSSTDNGDFNLTDYTPVSGGKWDVIASWEGNKLYNGTESKKNKFTVEPAEVAITIEASDQSLKIDQTLEVSGTATLTPENDVTKKEFLKKALKLIRINPHEEYEDVLETYPFISNDQLQYLFSDVSLPIIGSWDILIGLDKDESFAGTTTSTLEITVEDIPKDVAGYTIIVEGRVQDKSGLDSHNLTTNYVYDKFIARGFTDDEIFYFNFDKSQEGVDDKPTKQGILDAIKSWSSDSMNTSPAPLYIIFVGHGKNQKFPIFPDDSITANELNDALTELESQLDQEALKEPITVVIGANRSGGYIKPLSRVDSQRIIITSCDSEEVASKGPLPSDAKIRHGDYFVLEFMNHIAWGMSVKKSYELAAEKVTAFTENEDGNGLSGASAGNNRYFDDAAQHPLLEDNGDGIGTFGRLSSVSGNDGALSADLFIGKGPQSTFLEITELIDTISLEAQAPPPTFVAKVNDSTLVDTLWIQIASPNHTLQNNTEKTEQRTINIPGFRFDESDIQKNEYIWNDFNDNTDFNNFNDPGEYKVFYFGRESDTETITLLTDSEVIRSKKENEPPTPFNPISPINGTDTAVAVLFDWEDSTDPDTDKPVMYTLTISLEETFETIELQQKGLTESFAAIDKSGNLKDATTYYWNVLAIDVDGGTTEMGKTQSNTASMDVARNDTKTTASFTASLSNGYPGFVKGIVFDEETVEAIENATITLDGVEGSTTTTDTGAYLIELVSGEYTLSAEASGYIKKSITVNVNALDITEENIGLEFNTKSSAISGQVTDKKSGGTLEDVKIILKKESFKEKTKTDSNGNYSFTELEAGKYKLKAKKEGYNKLKEKIKLKSNQQTTKNITLKQES